MSQLALNGGKAVRSKPFPKWPVVDRRDEQAVLGVLRSGAWGRHRGRRVTEFEERWAALCGAPWSLAVANGTLAIETALRALSIGAGDEVILPSYTFVATASTVLAVGALPVFCDIDPGTFCIDPRKIPGLITARTRAILPVHIGGHPADMTAITAIARRRGLKVIEDAAQAHLASWRGRNVGFWGDLAAFSFQSSKNLSSGEGGAVVGSDPALREACWALHTCGRTTGGLWYKHPHLGWNFRMSEFHAALLLSQMARLRRQAAVRERNARDLERRLGAIPGIAPLAPAEGVTRHARHLFIFRYDARHFAGLPRDRFLKALQAEGIPCGGGYVPIHREGLLKETLTGRLYRRLYPGLRWDAYIGRFDLPETERACAEGVWLTQNLLLGTARDMRDIADAVEKILRHAEELRPRTGTRAASFHEFEKIHSGSRN